MLYKAHADGNDFLIFDTPQKLTKEEIYLLSHRRFGIGCDQIIIADSDSEIDKVKIFIFNQDGSESNMCGNAIRCVAGIYFENNPNHMEVIISTKTNQTACYKTLDGIKVNMGSPSFDHKKAGFIGKDLSELAIDGIVPQIAEIGNQHLVYFVPSSEMAKEYCFKYGLQMATNPLFLHGVNVEFVHVVSPEELDMYVWERGSGPTLSCGSGVTCSFFTAVKSGLCKEKVRINVPGSRELGTKVFAEIEGNGSVCVTGEYRMVGRIEI